MRETALRAAAAPSGPPSRGEPRKSLIFVAGPTHLRQRVALRNQPRTDERRDFTHHTADESIELDVVEFALARRFRDPDFHHPPETYDPRYLLRGATSF
jgi:hypothetical protein